MFVSQSKIVCTWKIVVNGMENSASIRLHPGTHLDKSISFLTFSNRFCLFCALFRVAQKKVEGIVKKYSNFVGVPIRLNGEVRDSA